jgi:putative transposase
LIAARSTGKEQAVQELLAAWRKCAVQLAEEQWRLFFETGRLDKNHGDTALASVVGAANRLQMCRWHVVGQLKSWLSNRANEFVAAVRRSSLPDAIQHQLCVVNACEAWFRKGELTMRETGEAIPAEVRALARRIMRHVMGCHRRPDLRHTNMVLDQRVVTISRATRAAQPASLPEGVFGPPRPGTPCWLRLSTMTPGQRIDIPLQFYAFFERRDGERALSVQVNRDRETGELSFGLITDMGAVLAASRAGHVPLREELALDFGLATLLATNEGDLLGRGWLQRLKRYDRRISKLAEHIQRSGGRPRDSRRYRDAVADLRGFITTEVGRILNRLIALKKPGRLIVERLDFRIPGLSRRLNRIVQNCGRSVFRSKLTELEQRFGITWEEVNPAYTSQYCSCCGYVDARNRREQAEFLYLWCGNKMHADVNASSNIRQRRSLPFGSIWAAKAHVLAELARRFCERWPRPKGQGRPGQRGLPTDPHLTNPYFQRFADAVRSSGASQNLLGTPDVVAA